MSAQTAAMMRLLILALILSLASCDQASVEQRPGDSLHNLARQGETRQLLAAVADAGRVDERDVCYRTPLMFAAQFGRHRQATAGGSRCRY